MRGDGWSSVCVCARIACSTGLIARKPIGGSLVARGRWAALAANNDHHHYHHHYRRDFGATESFLKNVSLFLCSFWTNYDANLIDASFVVTLAAGRSIGVRF